MDTYHVLYLNPNEGDEVQTFICKADDDDHAVEQCQDAEPDATICCVHNVSQN